MMLWALPFAAGLFVGMVVMQQVGHGIATRRIALDPEGAKKGAGVIEGAVFGLLSLLLAFTFSGAVTRFDTRRHLVSEEAIRIGTAFDRIELLPPMRSPACAICSGVTWMPASKRIATLATRRRPQPRGITH